MLKLLVNLDRSPERLEKTKKIFDHWHCTFERVSGVDGAKMETAALDKWRVPYEERRFFLKELTVGEIGCYLSHLKCWKTLLASKESWAFIAEDDVWFYADPSPYINSEAWIPEDVKLIQLGDGGTQGIPVYREKKIHQLADGRKLMVLRTGIDGGTRGYLIHRDAAEVLVKLSDRVYAPVDDMLFSFASPVRQHLKPWSMAPALLFTDDDGVSYVGDEKGKVKTKISKSPAKYLQRQWIKNQNKLWSMIFGVRDRR